jgi:hypothetical protein
MENQCFGNSTPHSTHVESQSKSWGSPSRELTKISKKNTQNRLILKGEMGDSSSFCSIWSVWSRADVSSSMFSCCLLGSRVLSEKGTGVPEGDLVWRGWVRAALPLEGSWLHLAMVDPWNNLCYLNCGGGGQNNNKRAPPVGLLWWNIPFLYQTASPGL